MSRYSELLKNPKWQRMRLEILNRDGWKCRRCGEDTKNLQVDHLYYLRDRLPWEYDPTALQTVCESCHAYVTAMRKALPSLDGEKWLVFRGGPIDDFGQFTPVSWREHDKLGYTAAHRAFAIAANYGGGGLRHDPHVHIGPPSFFLFKEDNNGTTYIVVKPGDEATALAMAEPLDMGGGIWEALT